MLAERFPSVHRQVGHTDLLDRNEQLFLTHDQFLLTFPSLETAAIVVEEYGAQHTSPTAVPKSRLIRGRE